MDSNAREPVGEKHQASVRSGFWDKKLRYNGNGQEMIPNIAENKNYLFVTIALCSSGIFMIFCKISAPWRWNFSVLYREFSSSSFKAYTTGQH